MNDKQHKCTVNCTFC